MLSFRLHGSLNSIDTFTDDAITLCQTSMASKLVRDVCAYLLFAVLSCASSLPQVNV